MDRPRGLLSIVCLSYIFNVIYKLNITLGHVISFAKSAIIADSFTFALKKINYINKNTYIYMKMYSGTGRQ